jgi:cell division protease FtsH
LLSNSCRVVAGLQKKNAVLSEEERRRVAYHELGHALVAMALPGSDPVHKVSIIPRSVGALGYTIQRPTGDRYLMTRQELLNKMSVLLGGRAAERIFFDDISTGAADDLQKVTDIARSVVTQYGMTDHLGQITYEKRQQSVGGMPLPQEQKTYSEETAREIDTTVRRLVDEAFDRTIDIIETQRDKLDAAAQALLKQETMNAGELRKYFDVPEEETGRKEAEAQTA